MPNTRPNKNIPSEQENPLFHDTYRKRLDFKTLKAYKIELKQFDDFCTDLSDCFTKGVVNNFIISLHK